MQKSLYQTADAGDTLSDSGCRSLSIRHRCRRHSTRQWMQEKLYQTADAEVSLSDSGCRRHSIRQRMQKSLGLDSGCRNLSIRQRMQETLYQTAGAEVYQTADAGDTLSDSGCRSLYQTFYQTAMQETLYQPTDAGVSL